MIFNQKASKTFKLLPICFCISHLFFSEANAFTAGTLSPGVCIGAPDVSRWLNTTFNDLKYSGTHSGCIAVGNGQVSLDPIVPTENSHVLYLGPGSMTLDGHNDIILSNETLVDTTNSKYLNVIHIQRSDQESTVMLKNLGIDQWMKGDAIAVDSNTLITSTIPFHLSLYDVVINMKKEGSSSDRMTVIQYSDYNSSLAKGNPGSLSLNKVRVTGDAYQLINAHGLDNDHKLTLSIQSSELQSQSGIYTSYSDLNINQTTLTTTNQADGQKSAAISMQNASHVKIHDSIINAHGTAIDTNLFANPLADIWPSLEISDSQITMGIGHRTASSGGIALYNNRYTTIQNTDLLTMGSFHPQDDSTLFIARGSDVDLEGVMIHAQSGADGVSVNRDSEKNTNTHLMMTGYVNPSTGLLRRSSITTTNTFSHGLFASMGGQVELSQTDILTEGDGSSGIASFTVMTGVRNDASIKLSNGVSIKTLGSRSLGGWNTYGILAWGVKVLDLDSTRVETQGNNSTGIYVNGSDKTSITNTQILSTGEAGYGLYLTDAPDVTLNKLAITTNNKNATGLGFSNANVTTMSELTVSTSGSNASGIYAVSQGLVDGGGAPMAELSLSQSTIEVKDRTSSAFMVSGTKNAVYRLSDSTLMAGGSLDDTESRQTPQGYAFSTASSFTGNASFIVDRTSEIYGHLLVRNGEASLALTDGSAWTGSALSSPTGRYAKQISVDASSQWRVQGSSEVGDLLNSGTITINQPSTSSGTYTEDDYYRLVVHGDYHSQGGTLVLNQELNERGLGDYFFVEGAVSGTTRLVINPTEQSGAATQGKGILMVYAGAPYDLTQLGALTTGTSPLSPSPLAGSLLDQGMFVLQNNVQAGAYQYTLVYEPGTGGVEGGWYLRSDCLTPDCSVPKPPQPPVPPEPPVPPPIKPPIKPPVKPPEPPRPPDNYRYLGVVASVAPSVAQFADQLSLARYRDRYGALDPKPEQTWARVLTASRNYNRLSGDSYARQTSFLSKGASFDLNASGVQVGRDLYTSDDQTKTAGAYVSVNQVNADVEQVYASHSAGAISLNSQALGVYWTWRPEAETYVDLITQLTRFSDIRIESNKDESFKTSGVGAMISLEFGRTFSLAQAWTVEPQWQLLYQHTSLEEGRFNNTFIIDYQNTHAWYSRLGVRATHTLNQAYLSKVWFSASVLNNLAQGHHDSTVYGGDRSIDSAQSLTSRLDQDVFELKAGVQGQLTANAHLEAGVTYTRGLNARSAEGVAGNLRFNYRW